MNKASRKKSEPKGWRWMRLGDISDIISGQSPTSDTYRKKPEGLPFYQGKTDFGLRSPTARVWCVAPKKIAMPGDILISVRAPVGPTNVADVECCIGRGLAIIRCKKNVNAHFVLSFLKFAEEKISQIGTGSVFDSINRNDLLNFQILLPPLAEQKAIAEVLSSLDDKIDLLHRQNKTLEDMAQTLFRQWFIKEANEEWEEVKLEHFVKCTTGHSYRSVELQPSKTALVTLKNFARDGSFRMDGYKEFKGKFKDEQIVNQGDLVVAHTDITQNADIVGNPALVVEHEQYETLIMTMDLMKVESSEEWLSKEFLFYLFKSRHFKSHCLGCTNGTTVLHMSRKAIPSYRFKIPNKEKIERFTENVKPNIEKKFANISTIKTLEKLRDTLLPKLISGKVSVRP